MKLEDGLASKAMLENNKCFLLDCGAEVFVWVGRVTQVDDRKTASKAAEVIGRKKDKFEILNGLNCTSVIGCN